MKKNVILQHYEGQLSELAEKSVENFKMYAKLVGADYELVRGTPFDVRLPLPCQKVFMLNEKFDEYDTVLMVDPDKFVRKGMEDNVFLDNGIGLYGPVQQQLHRAISSHKYGSSDYPYWGGAVYKLTLEDRILLRSSIGDGKWMSDFSTGYYYDEGIMHALAVKSKFKPKTPYFKNNKWCHCSYLPGIEAAGFIHIRTKITPTGPKRTKLENYNDLVERGLLT
jgi:hypothetical protein